MMIKSCPTCCVVCGGAISIVETTICPSCEQQIVIAFEALKEGGSVLIVPPSVN